MRMKTIIEFPCQVGDVGYSVCDIDDEYIVYPVVVKGLAFNGGKKFVIDNDLNFIEIGKEFFISKLEAELVREILKKKGVSNES